MKNKRRLRLAIIGVLCLLMAWPISARWKQISQRRQILQSRSAAANDVQFQQSQKSLSPIFDGVDKVESFRLASRRDALMIEETGKDTSGKKPLGQIDGFYYLATGETGGADFASRLGKVVLDARGYAEATLCLFSPTVAFQVSKGAQSVNVVICFDCNQLIVIETNPNVPLKSLGGTKRRFRIGGDFDVYRPELVTLAQESFPNDEKIQSLERTKKN
jgi:hypothetical protein